MVETSSQKLAGWLGVVLGLFVGLFRTIFEGTGLCSFFLEKGKSGFNSPEHPCTVG
jgi:hypothetical protein